MKRLYLALLFAISVASGSGFAPTPLAPESRVAFAGQASTIAAKTGVTALYNCDQGSGNLTDAIAGTYTLTARGTPTYSVSPAVEGTAINTDGTNDEFFSANVTPLGASLPDAWSVVFNVKGSAQAAKSFISFGTLSGGGNGRLSINTGNSAGVDDGKLRIRLVTAGNSAVIATTTSGTVLDGSYHHVAVVGSGGNTVTCYVDGVALTPLSGTWSSSRPVLAACSIGGAIDGSAAITNASGEVNATFDNVAMFTSALSAQDVADIYNAGVPDTTPPAYASASIPTDGTYIDVTLTEIGSPPLLPAASVTGFSATRLGNAISFASAARQSNTVIRLTASTAIPPGPVLVSYNSATGNVTDSSSNAMASFTNQAVTNNSLISTYAKITIVSSTASRMAPHPVFATLSAESVPINGDWSYCTATWDFGDGSSVLCTNPKTSNSVNSTTGQTTWGCAAHVYETAGTYTITATLTGSDGTQVQATQNVTIVADTRTTKYLNSAAAGGGDGSLATPWNTHAAMMAGLTSDTKVICTGTFNLTSASAVPASKSNVWFECSGATFNWSNNPASVSAVFNIPSTCENIIIDGATATSSVTKSLTKADVQGSFLINTGKAVALRNYNGRGLIANNDGLMNVHISGDTATGVLVLNSSIEDANNYVTVFEDSSYVSFQGCSLGASYVEHTQRLLAKSGLQKYFGHQWSQFDQKLWIGNGSQASVGSGAKDAMRYQEVLYATTHDCILKRGIIDIGYHDLLGTGYTTTRYVQIDRCILDDSGINVRPGTEDCAVTNNVVKDAVVGFDISTPTAGSSVSNKIRILHNSFIDTASASSIFINTHAPSAASHYFTKTNIEVDGNVFSVASGSSVERIFSVDDAELYTCFSSIDHNIMPTGLTNYTRTWNRTTQSQTANQNWATFTGTWATNDRETITAAAFLALTNYRPDAATYPTITSYGDVRTEGVLLKDLYRTARPDSGTWFVGAVDVAIIGTPTGSISADGTQLFLAFDQNATGHSGFTVSASRGPVIATYLSGDGTDSHTFSLSRVIYSGERVTFSYAPGDVEDDNGNNLPAFSSETAANNSTIPAPVVGGSRSFLRGRR